MKRKPPKDITVFLKEKINPLLNVYCKHIFDDKTYEMVISNTRLWIGEDRNRSALMGEYHEKNNKFPNGCIVLHIDALMDYAKFSNMDFTTLLATVLFERVYYMNLDNLDQLEINETTVKAANDFSLASCNQLIDDGILNEVPDSFVSNLLVSKLFLAWIKKWTGLTPTEWLSKINKGEG